MKGNRDLMVDASLEKAGSPFLAEANARGVLRSF
jgi:hypothetical protein